MSAGRVYDYRSLDRKQKIPDGLSDWCRRLRFWRAHNEEHDKVVAERRGIQHQTCGSRLSLRNGRLLCYCFITEFIWMWK